MARALTPMARVPRSAMERKPRHGQACTRCGVCCMATLCPLACRFFARPEQPGPCPALIKAAEHEYGCGLVAHAASPALREAALLLIGSGTGCDARFNGERPDVGFYLSLAKRDHDDATRHDAAWKLWFPTTRQET